MKEANRKFTLVMHHLLEKESEKGSTSSAYGAITCSTRKVSAVREWECDEAALLILAMGTVKQYMERTPTRGVPKFKVSIADSPSWIISTVDFY